MLQGKALFLQRLLSFIGTVPEGDCPSGFKRLACSQERVIFPSVDASGSCHGATLLVLGLNALEK